MHVVQCSKLELMEGWSEADPTLRNRFAFPISAETGAVASSVVYFEIDPGDNCGRHTHNTEEVIVVLDGEGEVEIGGERRSLQVGTLAHVPAFTPHNVHGTGGTLRIASVFAASAMVTKFEQKLAPMGMQTFVVGAPQPEAQPAL
jgi:quercetin dioxygenase-like cupin family protein